MVRRVQPTSFTAGRTLNLAGTVYAAGAAIPNAVVKSVRRLNLYLSRRWIVPNADPHGRKALSRTTSPRPTDLSPTERRNL